MVSPKRLVAQHVAQMSVSQTSVAQMVCRPNDRTPTHRHHAVTFSVFVYNNMYHKQHSNKTFAIFFFYTLTRIQNEFTDDQVIFWVICSIHVQVLIVGHTACQLAHELKTESVKQHWRPHTTSWSYRQGSWSHDPFPCASPHDASCVFCVPPSPWGGVLRLDHCTLQQHNWLDRCLFTANWGNKVSLCSFYTLNNSTTQNAQVLTICNNAYRYCYCIKHYLDNIYRSALRARIAKQSTFLVTLLISTTNRATESKCIENWS